tara:strand:+ start:10205 stop:10528 length:324 start_codon:yes stop_codon:yes gene_type:complete
VLGPPKHLVTGGAAEHLAIAALLRDGWWVAVARVPGPFDLVAVRASAKKIETQLLDVKAVAPSARPKQRSRTQQQLSVRLLYVDPVSGGVAVTVGRARKGEKTKILD